jgi:phage terminase large subunit
MSVRIRLSAKQAQAWRLLEHPEIAEVFAGGAAGGGKSWLGCLRQIYRRTTYADTRGFIGRRDYTALRDSTMKTYFTILKEMGYESDIHYRYNAQEHTVYFTNGSEQHFRHMSYQPSDPDYNRFGSTEYTDAFIDEAPEIDKRAAEIVLSRLRYNHSKHGITKELLLTGNPTDNWIKYRYVMDAENRFLDLPPHRARVLFTLADNPDTALRESYTKTLELLDDYDRARLLYGDWTAKPNIERPFAIQLDTAKHFRPCGFDSTKPLFISFDFNIDPFAIVYSHIWQDGDGWHFHVFDEETITGGTIDEGCDRIRQKVGNAVLSATITGDRNGTARSMTHRDHTTAYQLIRRQLLLSDRQFDLPPNPTHINSREDCNYLLRHFDDFRVDARAVNLRRDLRTVEVGPDGKILKENRAKDAQRADHLDAWRYLVNCKTLTSWRKFHNSRPR